MEDRVRVAQEAARLLYFGLAEEYIYAKETAALSLGIKSIPSNFEVANELDKLAEEIEGKERQNRLIHMREVALEILQSLKDYGPKLIGSVWRGTARKGSDIDIIMYLYEHEKAFHNLECWLPVTNQISYCFKSNISSSPNLLRNRRIKPVSFAVLYCPYTCV